MGTTKLTDRYVVGPDFYYGRNTEYQFNEAGSYKFESVGDASKSVEVEVLEYVPTPKSYLWLEPLDETDDNWYELQAYSEEAEDAGKYIKAGYQLTKSKNCQFYLRWGDGGSVITGIILDGFLKPMIQIFLLLWIKQVIMNFTIKAP